MAMFGANTVREEGGLVFCGAISDMAFKAVVGVFCGEVCHVGVAGNFGDDGGSGDFFNKTVGFFDSGNMTGEWGIVEKINDTVNDDFGKFDFGGEDLLDGTAGGKFEAGGKSILVDFLGGNPARDASRGVLLDEWSKERPFFGGKLFGVSEILIKRQFFVASS